MISKILRSVPRPILFIAAPVFLLSYIYLLIRGEWVGVGLMLANTVFLGLLMWLTARVTEPPPPEPDRATLGRPTSQLWAQLAVLAAVLLIVALPTGIVPLWSGIVEWLRSIGETYLPAKWFGGPGNVVANPVQYVIIPLVLLLALGAKPRELGLGRGHRVWPASLVWFIGPALILIVPAAMGALTAQGFIQQVISNFFQNGFSEEFLFRGALQTRLRYFMTTPWVLTVQAFVFGLWHLRANIESFGGDVLAGMAWCLVSQGVIGLALGFVFHRTRNLVAPTVGHVMINVMGRAFG